MNKTEIVLYEVPIDYVGVANLYSQDPDIHSHPELTHIWKSEGEHLFGALLLLKDLGQLTVHNMFYNEKIEAVMISVIASDLDKFKD